MYFLINLKKIMFIIFDNWLNSLFIRETFKVKVIWIFVIVDVETFCYLFQAFIFKKTETIALILIEIIIRFIWNLFYSIIILFWKVHELW